MLGCGTLFVHVDMGFLHFLIVIYDLQVIELLYFACKYYCCCENEIVLILINLFIKFKILQERGIDLGDRE